MEHASTIHIGARKQREGGINEDGVATAVLENHHRDTERPIGVFVLGDGVGGAAGGDVASFLATTVVRKRLVEALSGPATDAPGEHGIEGLDDVPTVDERPDDVEAWLRETIQEAVDEAHAAIQEYAREAGGRPATTVVVAVYLDGRLHYAWAGDSRLYLVNGDRGAIQQLTADHAVTNQLLEDGEIDDEEYARVHPDTTAITRAVGGSPYGEPTVDLEFGTADVYAGDRVLLTSDGLVDAFPNVGPLREDYERADDKAAVRETIRETLVTDDEIRDVVLDAESLATAAEDLVAFANDRGGKDNLSVVLARDPTAPETPAFLPQRGVGAGESLTDRETVIEEHGDPSTDRGDDADADEEAPTDGDGSEDADGADSGDANGPDGGLGGAPGDRRGGDVSNGDAPGGDGVGIDGDAANGDGDAGGRDVDAGGRDVDAGSRDVGTGSRDGETGPDDERVPGADVETDEGADGGGQAASESVDGPLDVVSLSDRGVDVGDRPTAAVAIEGHGRLYEVAAGFTVGRGVEGAEENPNLGLVIDDEAVEPHHARLEYDETAGYWRIRDLSDAGTYVRTGGEAADWDRLNEGDGRSAHRLGDDAELALQDPAGDPVTLHFFPSVERAQQRTAQSAGEGDGFAARSW
ncbi:MAG: protein phosphatase 2C domain-containing protein [Halobacteriales archaeon]